MATLAVLIFYVFTHFLILYSAESCSAFFCNEIIGAISFPFKNKTQNSPECGYYTVDCSDHQSPKIQLKDGGYWFQFESINQYVTVFINDRGLQERIEKLEGDTCDDDLFNDLSLPMDSPLLLNISTHNLTLFRCRSNTLDKTPSKDPNYACRSVNYTYYTVSNDSLDCSPIRIPIDRGSPSNVYNPSALTAKFFLGVPYSDECTQCYRSGGKCLDIGEFKCAPSPEDKCWNEGQLNCSLVEEGKCWDVRGKPKCANKGDQLCRLKILLGTAAGVVVLVAISCCYFWEKKRQHRLNVEAFLKNYGPLQVRRYSYPDVKKITNSFKKKLGQGGYGGVYKGELR